MKGIPFRSFILLGLVFMSVSSPLPGADQSLINPEHKKAGWLFFGYGYLDSGYNLANGELVVDVGWTGSSWGIGGLFVLDDPINGKDVKYLQVDIRSENGSQTHVYAGVSTNDDSNLVIDRSRAEAVTRTWTTFRFAFAEMRQDKPDKDSRDFLDSDWNRIEIVKLLFTKPGSDDIPTDRIVIRNPRLVYLEGRSPAKKKDAVDERAKGTRMNRFFKRLFKSSGDDNDTRKEKAGRTESTEKKASQPTGMTVKSDERLEHDDAQISAPRDKPSSEKSANRPERIAGVDKDMPKSDDAATMPAGKKAQSGDQDDAIRSPKKLALYADTMKAVENAKSAGKSSRHISGVLAKGAAKARDAGDYESALKLFEKSVVEDSTNVAALRAYGDYLMGYRGQYELAAEIYDRAMRMIESDPDAYEDDVKNQVRRSIAILHRDGKDGMPIFKSDDFSVYFEAYGLYKNRSANDEDALVLWEAQSSSFIRIDEHIDEEFGRLVINGGTVPTEDDVIDPGMAPHENTVRKRVRILRLRRARLAKTIKRYSNKYEAGGKLNLRFGNPDLPYFKFALSRTTVEPNTYDASDVRNENESQIINFTALAGKNFILSPYLDLNLEVMFTDRNTQADDHKGNRLIDEDIDQLDVDTKFTHYFGTNTLRFSLGGTWTDIERTESRVIDLDDRIDKERASLRLSLYNPPFKTENPSRFRGRRSDHYEIGFERSKRVFQNDPRTRDYKPYLTAEYFGLLEGQFDLTFIVKSLLRDYIRGPKDGAYDSIEFGVTPTWILEYELYDDDFFTGTEFFSVGFPNVLALDDHDGSFDRWTSGVRVEKNFVTKSGIRILPTLIVDYSYYPNINRDDWGFFAECALRY